MVVLEEDEASDLTSILEVFTGFIVSVELEEPGELIPEVAQVSAAWVFNSS